MKKIVLLFMIVCLWGCSQQKEVKPENTDAEKFNQIMENIKIVMPVTVYDELTGKEVYNKEDDTYLIANEKENPTLRLDFTYQNDKLIQYVCKEYDFIDTMKDEKINEDQAKNLVKLFAKTFLKEEVTLTKTIPLSGYETENYMTFEDQNHSLYLVYLNKNIVLKYMNQNS